MAFSAMEQRLDFLTLNNLTSSSTLMRVKWICKLPSSPPSLDLFLQKTFWGGPEAAGALPFCDDRFVQRMNSTFKKFAARGSRFKGFEVNKTFSRGHGGKSNDPSSNVCEEPTVCSWACKLTSFGSPNTCIQGIQHLGRQ